MQRDHSGPLQGRDLDDGLTSLAEDCKYLDIIHIDPWKSAQTLADGYEKTLNLINYCNKINPNILFEIGTEQSIYQIEPEELENMIIYLKNNLDYNTYKKIIYIVIQSGTSIKNGVNTGNFSKKKLNDFISIANKYQIMSKEHNGDYISFDDLAIRFKNGLNAINIAPEFGRIETDFIIKEILEKDPKQLENLFSLCLKSNKWKKWVNPNFIIDLNKIELIRISCHYLFSNQDFLNIKNNLKIDNKEIVDDIYKKLNILTDIIYAAKNNCI
jgi:hypothetical protein